MDEIIEKYRKIKNLKIYLSIGIFLGILSIPILIAVFFSSGINNFFSDITSLDKIAFKSMVESSKCRNPKGVVMAAEWLYDIAGTRPDGTKPENYLEYAISNGHGKSLAYGWDPRWDEIIPRYKNPYTGEVYAQREGLDCSGFVRWAFWNAGFTEASGSSPSYTINANGTVAKWGIKRDPIETTQPGDYAWRNGHIGVVVEVTDKGAYVVESKGHKPDLRRSFYSFDSVKNGSANFTGFYYSTMYDLGDSNCDWNMPTIYANSSILVNVNGEQVTLEQYVIGSISHELDYNANINAEALKAQAIAIRSYMLSNAVANSRTSDVKMSIKKDVNGEYKFYIDVYDTSAGFQRYGDPLDKINQAEVERLVSEVITPTAGMVVAYNDKIVSTEYSTCSEDGKRYKLPTKTEVPILFTKTNVNTANEMKEKGLLSGKYDNYWQSRSCAHNRGMEQAGAVLMPLINGWTYTDIVSYYYDGSLVNINTWLDAHMTSLVEKFYVSDGEEQ